MTDNEIIKALECCSTESVCDNCPYGGGCINQNNNTHFMAKDALALINRQKAEIERLEFDNVHWNDWEVKCRAINEFAEKLPEIIPHFDDGHTTMECVVRAVKNLVKELTNKN